MFYLRKTLLILCFLFYGLNVFAQTIEADVCVYGGTSAGVIAAYTAKKLNKTVVLIEPGKHLGGLTSGGLGYTDIGNKYAITGLSRNFYRRIGKHYGRFEQWIFEPHVAEQTFKQYVDEAQLKVVYEYHIIDAVKENGAVKEINLTHSGLGIQSIMTVKAKVFIDCSYEGDLMAKAGVSYTVGREANSEYHETYNGVQLRDKHQFADGIDPYKIPGKPESGLLWGISAEPLASNGDGDKKVQAYNFRICLTNDSKNFVPIDKPAGYDASKYELLLRVIDKIKPKDLNGFMKIDEMPNHKTDINNNGAFSTDMIGMNYDYPDADYTTRSNIQQAHEDYAKGLLYFIGHDERMPQYLRTQMLQWGYPKDEYTDNNHWSHQMYIREARRMVGEYVMTQANCEGREVATDEAGMAAYTMDSHNCQRITVNGMVKNEGDVQIGGFGPYPVSYKCLVPKANECSNLLVPVCLSASHIAYGSIRMEPVFMVLAQSSATAAVLAIDNKQTVQQVDVKRMQQILKDNPLVNGSTPEILVDNDDAAHVVLKGDWQRVTKGSYGPSMYTSGETTGENKSVKFTPDVAKAGKYHIYSYLPRIENLSGIINVKLFDGKKKYTHVMQTSSVKVEGQTSGEWIDLGAYSLKKGNKAFVEINSDKSSGVIVADAVLFIPE